MDGICSKREVSVKFIQNYSWGTFKGTGYIYI